MFVCPDDGGYLAAGDALVGDSDPHVVARQHDLRQLKGCSSYFNFDQGSHET